MLGSVVWLLFSIFFFKQKTAYEMRISDWSSDVCSSDLNRISITPFKPLPEPKGLASIKSEIGQRWPMTGLLDVLKEAALDTGLMDAFETPASRVTLSKAALAQRLLLCLYGLGTNAGLKRVIGRAACRERVGQTG